MPKPEPDFHITQNKYDQLKSKLAAMLKSRPPLIEEMQLAAQDGDFSENAGYQQAKFKLRRLNSGMEKIETILKHSIIISPSQDGSAVELGHTVTVEFNGKQKSYQILGSLESDPKANIISHKSPIGALLLGKKIGDTVINKLEDREIVYKILKIE